MPLYSWTLATPAPVEVAPVVAALAARAPDDFLGRGLVAPLRRDLKNDFATASGAALVRACVLQILGTWCSSEPTAGELPWRPEFGSQLFLLRHRNNNVALAEVARAYVAEAIARWEPRVTVTEVAIRAVDRELRIDVTFEVIDRNTPGNAVVLPEQTVTLALSA